MSTTTTTTTTSRPIFATSEIGYWPEAMKEDFVRQFVDLETRELIEDPVGVMTFSMLDMFYDVWEEYDLADDLGDFMRAFGEYSNDIAWNYARAADEGCRFP